MSEPIRVACPHCGGQFVSSQAAGQLLACPHCHRMFRLHDSPADPPVDPPAQPPPPAGAGASSLAPCQRCGQQMQLNASLLGQTLACPSCGWQFTVIAQAGRFYAQPAAGQAGPAAAGMSQHREVGANTVNLLRRTRPWVIFVAVVMLIGVGVGTLGLLVNLGMAGSAGGPTGGMICVVIAIQLVALGMWAFLAVLLLKYGSAIRQLTASGRTADLDRALDAQRAYWLVTGIILIVSIAIALLMFFVMIAFIGSAASHAPPPWAD